ncbi:multidrug DMT transporter permease [Acetobacteraceae bacterium H6797]|nr:multidrug DMT transporter permease [Acetobacteraceae bacterium H6797]
MDIYFVTVVVLSVGAFIHSRCSIPELRPSNEAASTAWKYLAKLAFIAWLGMLVWGVMEKPWTSPLAAVMGSLAANALIASRGPRPFWPGLSMLFCVIGVFLAVWLMTGQQGF